MQGEGLDLLTRTVKDAVLLMEVLASYSDSQKCSFFLTQQVLD